MIASFSEELFPLRVAFGTSGGPERRTEIVRLTNGYETRNQRHRHSVRRYDAGSGIRSIADLELVLAFFEARRGSLVGFRFRDPFDRRSSSGDRALEPFDQPLGEGDGAATRFALAKTYGSGDGAYRRPIAKPVAGTVRVAVGGRVLAEGVGFAVDAATGAVTFAAPPAAGERITAGFEFDVPVRFDLDQLSFNLAAFQAGEIPTIPLVEVRP